MQGARYQSRWEGEGETGRGVGGWGRGQDTHQRIAAENEKHAANGTFYMSGSWAWHSWVDGTFPRRGRVVLVEENHKK